MAQVEFLGPGITIMTWNYRVVHKVANGEDIYAIHEAYYEGNEPTSITEEPATPQGETLEELKDDFEYYLKALAEPVLEYTAFNNPTV